MGRHYFDVDIGLGSMDMKRTYFHNDPTGQVPLLGAVVISTKDAIAKELEILKYQEKPVDFDVPETMAAATSVAEMARDCSETLNGMIASRPHNPNIVQAIEQLRSDALAQGSRLTSGMVVNPALIFGANQKPCDSTELNRVHSLTVPPYLFDISHLTQESDAR